VAWLGRKIRNRSKRSADDAAVLAPSQGPAAVLPPGGVHGIPQPHGHGAPVLAASAPVAPAPPGQQSDEDAPE
jgi:hypothetical protein